MQSNVKLTDILIAEDNRISSSLTQGQQKPKRADLCYRKARLSSSFFNSAMDDATICQLIKTIIENPDKSKEQEIAFKRLIPYIAKLPGIYKSQDAYYEEAFNEALGNIAGVTRQKHSGGKHNLLSFAQKHKLNRSPQQVREDLVKWFNHILKKRLIDYYRQNGQELSLDNLIDCNSEGKETFLDQVQTPNLSGLDLMINEEQLQENRQEEEQLKQQFETGDCVDPEIAEELAKFPEGYETCTCGVLIFRKEVQKQKWPQILKELKVINPNIAKKEVSKTAAYRTVTSHYSRHCKPLVEKLPSLNLLKEENHE
jgi:hypothetical protein